jgi:hypothetical protein
MTKKVKDESALAFFVDVLAAAEKDKAGSAVEVLKCSGQNLLLKVTTIITFFSSVLLEKTAL